MIDIDFYFDPSCPWAWRASIWIREVRERRTVAVHWKLLSLELVNAEPEDGSGPHAGARPALRTLALARREGGDPAVDRLYLALGGAIHARQGRLGDRCVLEQAVAEAGMPANLPDRALADASTWEEVMAEESDAYARLGAFGVPTIALGGRAPGTYGPVLRRVPEGAKAAELWDHFAWLAANPDVVEIKKRRTSSLSLDEGNPEQCLLEDHCLRVSAPGTSR
jgi:2-hydroxychromene-2-carboxylate isomerase